MLDKPIFKRDNKEAYLFPTFEDVHCWALRLKALYLRQVLKKQAEQEYGDNITG